MSYDLYVLNREVVSPQSRASAAFPQPLQPLQPFLRISKGRRVVVVCVWGSPLAGLGRRDRGGRRKPALASASSGFDPNERSCGGRAARRNSRSAGRTPRAQERGVMLPRFRPSTALGRWVGQTHPRCRHLDTAVAAARAMHAEGVPQPTSGKALGVPRPTIQSWIVGRCRTQQPVRVIVRRVTHPSSSSVIASARAAFRADVLKPTQEPTPTTLDPRKLPQ